MQCAHFAKQPSYGELRIAGDQRADVPIDRRYELQNTQSIVQYHQQIRKRTNRITSGRFISGTSLSNSRPPIATLTQQARQESQSQSKQQTTQATARRRETKRTQMRRQPRTAIYFESSPASLGAWRSPQGDCKNKIIAAHATQDNTRKQMHTQGIRNAIMEHCEIPTQRHERTDRPPSTSARISLQFSTRAYVG